MKTLIIYICLVFLFLACQSKHHDTSQAQLRLTTPDLKYWSKLALNQLDYCVYQLDTKVEHLGNTKESKERIRQAMTSLLDFREFLSHIKNLRIKLFKEINKHKENDKEIIRNFMLGKIKNGKKLRIKVQSFIDSLYIKYEYLGFSKSYNDFPKLMTLSKSLIKDNKTYEEVYFSNCSWAECENILLLIESKLIFYEGKILKKMGCDDLVLAFLFKYFLEKTLV